MGNDSILSSSPTSSHPPPPPSTPVPIIYQYTSSSLSFTQGFLLGQLSICILIALLLKYFIFGESPSVPLARRRRRNTFSTSLASPSSYRAAIHQAQSSKGPSALRPSPNLTASQILNKTYYNVHHHQAESVDWFNVLIAQTLAQLRTDAQQDEAVLSSLTAALNGPRRPDFLGPVRVTEINLGEEFPIFSNCRVIPVEAPPPPPPARDPTAPPDADPPRPGSSSAHSASTADGTRLQARMDVDLSDTITLGIETKLLLNYPRPAAAAMPVMLAVSVVRFSGTLSISFIPSPGASPHAPASADPTPPTTLTFSFLPDYRLELSTRSLLGGRARLQDVPKIASLIEGQLCAWFDARCVAPRFQQIVLPSLWPRKRTTRGGDGEDATGSDGAAGAGDGGTPSKGHARRKTGGSGISMAEVQKLREERRAREQREREREREEAVALDTGTDGSEGVEVGASTGMHREGGEARFRMPGSMP